MESQIDPIEYGELRGAVTALAQRVKELSDVVDTLAITMHEAKGGWKILAVVSSVAVALGAAASWVATHLHISTAP